MYYNYIHFTTITVVIVCICFDKVTQYKHYNLRYITKAFISLQIQYVTNVYNIQHASIYVYRLYSELTEKMFTQLVQLGSPFVIH